MKLAQVETLITDCRFQELKYRQEKSNVFTVVGQTHTEHWHSSFMSWLLDPNSALGLGHFPLARLLSLYIIKMPDTNFGLEEMFCMHLNDIHFVTEKHCNINGKKRSIDVYGESDELIIVIENKVNAEENFNHSHIGQTQDYYDYAESHKKPGQRILYFFITPNPKQKPFSKKYVHITYQEMYDNIISKCIQHPQVSENSKYLLEQYASNLRERPSRNANYPMALVNIDICKSLYQDYTDILDEIFKQAEADKTQDKTLGCIVYEHYKDIFDEIYLSVDEKYGKTPNSSIQRQIVTFTDMYNAGVIKDGMKFSMKYDGIEYKARASVSKSKTNCFLVVLDEDGNPYRGENGNIIGVYNNSSTAAVDVINFYRKKHKIPNRVSTLRGTVYWRNEEGKSVKELIDSMQ